jgi:enoyl-CoA hydratase/carnithine racemase
MTVEALGSARVVSWENPGRLNAWGRATIEEIADAIEAAAADTDVRCVVARGAGENFSAGDDLREAAAADGAAFAATIDAFQRLTRVVLAAPVPVIAAIDGVCIGGALEFAASCDLRLATERARFGTPEVRIGLAATNAGTLLLPEVLGESAARELLLTGALRDATWMRERGFLNAVVAADGLDAAVAEWAASFDQTARPAVERTKRLLNDRFGELLPAAMERETQACIDLFATEEAAAAVQGFAGRD